MVKKNVLVLGAGGVGAVVAHKCAQNNDILGDVYVASRTVDKCESIIEGIHRKGSLKDPSRLLQTRQIDALNVDATAHLIKETNAGIVINVASPQCNMAIMDACLEAGSAYLDTAVHEGPHRDAEPYPWYANWEWKKKNLFANEGITAILGVGFDPGVVNAYCSHARTHHFDKIDTIDIIDVNAGDHGRFFATNFDPETNLNEIAEEVGYWEDRQWKQCPPHSKSRTVTLPVVGKHRVYLMGHDEVHSLPSFIDASSIRFWMGFSDHYINCFNVLKGIGLLGCHPVRTAEGLEVTPISVVKACLPDPASLAPRYTGKTCIGTLVKGTKGGRRKEVLLYNICDHQACYREVESQAISYTAGVPPVAAAILVAQGQWDVGRMVNVEELDPDPFLDLLNEMGLPMEINADGSICR